jgi:hypothetical protein
LPGQENLASWHASTQVIRKGEAFSQAGKQAGRKEDKQGRHSDAGTWAQRRKLASRNREEQVDKQ